MRSDLEINNRINAEKPFPEPTLSVYDNNFGMTLPNKISYSSLFHADSINTYDEF